MKYRNSPSANIIRDQNIQMDYSVTPNSQRIAFDIFNEFKKGFHSFTLIGSFGTGKSSFLWALQQTLTKSKSFFDINLGKLTGEIKIINFIGEYASMIQEFNDRFDILQDLEGNQKLFDKIFEEYDSLAKKNGLLVIAIDEFGKFLEYSAKNDPEKEMYFVQKLAEFVNKPERNILLLTTLHQSIESYGTILNTSQIQEWKKVKGRFKELTFNEPVEQLLYLASSHFKKNIKSSVDLKTAELIDEFNLFKIQNNYLSRIESDLYPLDAVSAFILGSAVQRYGQNERSLFTFLNSIDYAELIEKNHRFNLAALFDYLFKEFYQFLTSKLNPDYSNWFSIKTSIERVEAVIEENQIVAIQIVKSIGLLSIFSGQGSKLNDALLCAYLSFSPEMVAKSLSRLTSQKIIRFNKFNNSYKLFDGTDLDIEHALIQAENQIEPSIDILAKLKSHFQLPIITAKSISYKTGTPRLFEFVLSEKLFVKEPIGEIDGFINLIFGNKADLESLVRQSNGNENATLYGFFKNSEKILETLVEIQKLEKVLKDMRDQNDRVAIKELQSIEQSQKKLLNHYVIDSLYSDKVSWFRNGKKIPINDKIGFNKQLSRICEEVYHSTPKINNELFNKHNVSGAISSARRNLWRALEENWEVEDLGFEKTKWPAEKTIYYTLLKQTGIHKKVGDSYILTNPDKDSGINSLWDVCERFLVDARDSKKSITDLIDILSKSPYKIKQGVVDFWVPIFLFIRRGDFALYKDTGFVPYLNEQTLYMLTRNAKEYELKSFELNGLRLTLFNKYREFLKQDSKDYIDADSFIESIRPLLIFYRDLTDYGRETKTISSEAINLREAIAKAKDPEETFFEAFPSALGYSTNELATDKKVFDEYIIKFQNTIQEIKASFSDLKDRLESFINQEILGRSYDFPEYKNLLQERFSSVKEHQVLTKHRVLLMRINSNLDDRDSWLMSVAQAVLGKNLYKIKDVEEKRLKDKLALLIKELDNLTELNKVEHRDDEVLIRLELTSKESGLRKHTIRVPKSKLKALENSIDKIKKELDIDKSMKIPVLMALLKQELENE